MSSEVEKSEILNWIQKLKDSELIHRIFILKKESERKDNVKSKRKAGDGKYLISYIADDFDAPLDDFKDYMPSRIF